MDFFNICEEVVGKREDKKIIIRPNFVVGPLTDFMIRGRAFYAIWDEDKDLWSTKESDVQRLVDRELKQYYEQNAPRYGETPVEIRYLRNYGSKTWKDYRGYLKDMYDCYHTLDEKITFMNTKVRKSDYASKRVPYDLEEGSIDAYDELMSVLYSPEEREKLEWAIGSIIAGDSKDIQKFIVLYGEPGSGKSTFLNIVQQLFPEHYISFEAKALTTNNNAFGTEMFRSNPLIAIQHDGDLSRIEDNTKLNSIISHEEMVINEKFKAAYTSRLNAFLFMGTNKPVKITDAKAGILRRLIDVNPTGDTLPTKQYFEIIHQIPFELGAIANHCLSVYLERGKSYYSKYRPIEMIYQTDMFFNFVEDNYFTFKQQEYTSLAQAFEMYKQYCTDSSMEFRLPKYKFREELKSYFEIFEDRTRIDGKQVRSIYRNLLTDKFSEISILESPDASVPLRLTLDQTASQLDSIFSDCPAQYANDDGIPTTKWVNVETTLKDLDTTKIHFVKPPQNHIVIDFDLKDDDGKKSMSKNLEAANKWPPTYSEFSKSGAGVHLHYIYSGDVERLCRIFEPDIEIKVFVGNASLRRKLTYCNNSPIATLSSGLPLKGEKMIDATAVQSEARLRALIEKNLRKEIHAGTKPSIDFIHKILEDAYSSGLKYDVTDMRPRLLVFATNSTNQSEYCVRLVSKMKFSAKEDVLEETPEEEEVSQVYKEDTLVFYDVEVFPNLFVVVWKRDGGKKVYMINPSPEEIGELIKFKLVGFNCRRYDNHILYARYIGKSIEELYDISQRIINNSRNGTFANAYRISYTDVYDFSSKKQSLKKFELELGIHHMELGLPWDEPAPEEMWEKVAEYCGNDVDATEATFHARKEDFIARLILAELSGLTPNDTTQQHTARIIFGNDPTPQNKFVYTDLSEMFPGYKFELGKSTYRGEEVGEGGYVHSEPGMYSGVPVLDIASMHPTSAILMNIFGPYTKNFKELLDARLAIKHKDYELAKTMLGGILTKHLDEDPKALSYSLKIVINIVYGLTAASFANKFRDPRNIDNIVAKRGALFMIDLKHAVREKGFTVAHIKTDSIKIPNATPEIIDFVIEFGAKYGYTFEKEETYSRFCLVNDSVYIAKIDGWENSKDENLLKAKGWTATGAQFAQPYVFKTLFSGEPIEFDDMSEIKTVNSALYLDLNEKLPEDEHNYIFVGKAGCFCPVKPGTGGGLLLREKDGKYYAATGTKGYRWREAEMIKELGKESDIDRRYYDALVDDAITNISKYGDFEWFISDNASEDIENPMVLSDTPPWAMPCGRFDCGTPDECPSRIIEEKEGKQYYICKRGFEPIPF